MDFITAINILAPKADIWDIPQNENEFNELKWTDTNPKPDWQTVQAKIIELQADYDSKQYQRDRSTAYPSWQDQLDNIFHNGIDAWKAEIQAIKDQFPKP